MRLLLDQGLPRSTAEALGRHGLQAVHAGELGMATASDPEILARARREQEVIVTFDADFHALLALSNEGGPSVIRVRLEGLRGPELASVILRTVALCSEDLSRGAMVTVDKHSIRVRVLPLAPR